MTILRVKVDDRTLAALQARADASRVDVETAATTLLVRAADLLPPSGRTLVLSADDLEILEPLLGGLSILSPADLHEKIARLAGISYGHVRLPFSPGQLEEIASRAERLSLSPEEFIQRTGQKMYELFFTHAGQGVGA